MGYVILFILNLLFPLGGLAVIAYFFFSSRKKLLENLRRELDERLMLKTRGQIYRDGIWIHAASVGEVRSAVKIAALLKNYYKKTVLITTSTCAGKESALREVVFDKAVLAPLDFYPVIRKFIKIYHPSRLFIIESDIWPNMIVAAAANKIPVAVLNGRISAKSTKRLKLISPLCKLMFTRMAFICAQTQEIKERYMTLGADKDKITVCGNIKYDMLNSNPYRKTEAEQALNLIGWQGKQIVTCGSTHEEEEEIIFDAAKKASADKKDIRFIFAPRHLERKEEVLAALQKSGLKYLLLSEILLALSNKKNDLPQDAQIVFTDIMGWLGALYKNANLTFVGGSIAPRGGHNFLEAAVMSRPILLGQHYFNAPEVAKPLLEQKAGFLVNKDNFYDTVCKLLSDVFFLKTAGARAGSISMSFKGALQQTLTAVKNYERKQQ